MLVRMAKVHVLGHRRRLDDVLALLHRLGVVHLIDASDDPDVLLPPLHVDETHLREIEDLRYLEVRIDAILNLVPNPPAPDPEAEPTEADLGRLRRELDEDGPELERLVARRDDLTAEQEILPRYIASLRRLLPLVPELTDLVGYDTTAVLIQSRYADVLGELNAALTDTLGANFEVISDHVDPDTIGAVLVFPKEQATKVEALLGREQLTRIRLPRHFQQMPFRQAITAMEHRLADLPVEIAGTTDAIDDFVRPHGNWATCRDYLSRRLEQLSAIRHLGATSHTFVLSGWVPESAVTDLTDALADEIGPDVMLEDAVASPDEHPPVLMDNPAPARPFESLVGLLALPRYGTIDPTRLMALFLPLFFGMMLGDVAYGAVLLAIGFLLYHHYRRRPGMARDLSLVLMMSAGWAIIWGFIYGEFLGDLGGPLFGMRPLWMHREEAIEPLLLFAIAVGAVHVVLGILLGVFQAIRSRQRHRLAEHVAMLVALSGLFLIAAVATDHLPSGFMTPAAAAVIVGLVVLMVLGGSMGIVMGPLNLLGTAGHILSYLRLAAIGLASVYLARVANELGAAGPLWIGVIVAALFHALNLALGTFSPAIQALRLHYVEFFGSFYESGGEAFQPFGADARSEQTTAD